MPAGDDVENRYRILFGLATLTAVTDQATKALVAAYIPEYRIVSVISGFFDLVHIRNRGAAFGILNRSDIEWQFWLFLCAALVAVWAILRMVRESGHNPLLFRGLWLILGGAIGNLADRLRYRSVLDFLDFYVAGWHWPAFNAADVGICVGTCLVCLALYRNPGAAR